MTRRRRLLFVCSRYLFPIDSGGKIRTVNILRGLKGGAFEIILASPLPPGTQDMEPAEVHGICDRFLGWLPEPRGTFFRWTRLRHLGSRVPIAVATDHSSAGEDTIKSAIGNKPDIVVVDFPHAAVLAMPPYPCASVLFTHNVEAEIFHRHAKVASNPFKRAVWRSQAGKMERYERELLPGFSAIVAVAERDKSYFESHYGVDNVSVIPTGVDLEYFSYHHVRGIEQNSGGTIVFTGSMDWMANVDGVEFFMDAVWPIILQKRPNVRCVIVGRSPPRSLVERAKSLQLNWEFTGFVDDVRPFVREAHVYVIPLRVGGGTRIKVYEAMAMGCPVVSTRIGVEGLPVLHGKHFYEADSADAMAQAVVSLLHDQPRRVQLSSDARHFVEKHMSAQRAAQVFEEICLRALS